MRTAAGVEIGLPVGRAGAAAGDDRAHALFIQCEEMRNQAEDDVGVRLAAQTIQPMYGRAPVEAGEQLMRRAIE
ncbi:hypothetical protein DEM25_011280 [Oceaniradius stylonematis]|uniref:Uncharacterized protein n=1 Tax=Oceaniradius stylonematis TaxID=2184161 RepID=A0A3A8A8H5_9HYPH|nr:hypothetical protein DEM25_011280 [Oceaniradius stylonematis]RNC93675.1 MAG: hypothetical protein ED558_12345 [Oricola sp.]